MAQKHGWTELMVWSLALEEKADLVIFDPSYFDKKADGYGEKSISGLQRKDDVSVNMIHDYLVKNTR